MFDSFSRSFGSTPSQRVESDTSGTLDPVVDPFFGAVASYQICGCCGNFHGAADGTNGGGQGVILNADDRGSFGPNGKPSLDPIDAGAQITRSNWSWANGLGQPAVVTFAFRDTFLTTIPEGTFGHNAFTADQISATLAALAAWSDVANITFQRVSDAGTEYSESATILFGNYTSGQQGAAAFAYLPGGMPGATAAGAVQGDVWINSSLSYNANPMMQAYGQQVLLHEIGHAIGLSHPAAYNASANGVITYDANATYFEDSRQYTVMSYFSESFTGGNFGGRYSAVPLLDDIAAAQRLYGANMTTRTGDTVYGFNSNAGQPWFTATTTLSALIFAVWDAGGTDTFDFSGYSVAQTIDLRQGAFSSVGGLVGNVAIAIGAVIENVQGGTGADTIRGNSAANLITSNGGNDQVDGGLGTDTVVFSGARNNYVVTWNGQVGTVTGLGQTVTVSNVEFLQFSDTTIAAAPTGGLLVGGDITNETVNGTVFGDTIGGLGGNDTINGLAGTDTLDGGSGNDILNGGDHDDLLIGGRGDDALNGGSGHDVADYTDADSGVTVSLVSGLASGGAGIDTLSGIEELRGSAYADTLTGDGNANILHGGGGIDTMNGGGGADQMYGGAPGEAGGAPDIVKAQGTANNSIANAVSLAGGFDLGTRSDVVDSTTLPHATVVATSHGGMEYYAITVAAGETVIFDIDNASFDSVLRIFTAGNVQLAQNDDNAADGGSPTDSGLSHTFATAGTYYVQVSQWQSGADATLVTAPPPVGGTYTLHVSQPNAPVVPLEYIGATMNGEAGADALNGGVGRDTLNGGADDDLLNGGLENDTIDGGSGTDTAVFTGLRSSYTISTAAGVTTVTGPNGTDSLTNVEQLEFADGLFDITGAPLNPAINGTSGADALVGTANGDTINGLDGDDTITGGLGNDTIDGGTGLDTAVFSGTIAGSAVSTFGGVTTVTGPGGADSLTNVERLRFSDGTLIVGANGGQYYAGTANADGITGTAFNDQIEAAGGDDTITGGAGADVIDGGAGTDIAVFSGDRSAYTINTVGGVTTVSGPDGADSLTNVERLQFADGLYLITGAPVVNTINGTVGPDTLVGTSGFDSINGGDGDDVITGGASNDTLSGGAGVDTAVFAGLRSAYTVNTVGGTTTVSGPDGTDTLTTTERLRFDDMTLIVGAGGGQYFEGTAGANTINATVFNDQIYGLGGNDVINALAGNDVVYGGDGDDTVTAGGGADILYGGEGADRLEGDSGDQLHGENGDDVLVVQGSGVAAAVLVSGGAGTDTLILRGTSASLNLAAGTGLADSTVLSVFATENVTIEGTGASVRTIAGSSGANRLTAAAGSTFGVEFDGAGGDDILAGALGDDVLIGGTGIDQMSGGEGADRIEGDAGDQLLGENGDDTLVFTGSATTTSSLIVGGAGIDTAVLRGASTSINLATGTGTVGSTAVSIFTTENVVVEGVGTGLRSVSGNSAANRFEVGALGNDGSFAVNFQGQGGDDVLHGGAGGDTLDGGTGDDLLRGGAGTDLLIGGSGIDAADYTAAAGGVTASLTAGAASNDGDGGTDGFSGVENLLGSAFGDSLTGNGANNLLSGGAGNDTLDGLNGDDVLIGGAGVDVLHGGGGIDTVDYSGAAAGMRAQLNTNASTNDGDGGTDTFSGVENLTGSAFNDILIGDGVGNVLRGGLGSDTLIGLGGNDVLWGGSGAANVLQGGTGDDLYVLEAYDSITEFAAEGTDTVDARINTYVLANNVENLIFGGTGDFAGTGNAANNVITGGAGADVLRGRGGTDTLNGSLGIDTADYTLAAAGVVVRLDLQRATNDGDGATDTFTSIENAIGSNFNDVMFGDGGNNLIQGGNGSDVLLGMGGDDILMGGSGGVNNQLQGGTGNDWYILDAFDTCVEFAGEGIDTVEARIGTYTLGNHIENLLYTGPGKFVGGGNALNNQITGGALNDILRGGGGDDVIDGGLGNDELQLRGTKAQYTVTAEGDGWRIIDSVGGRDGSTYVESIELLRFSGNTTTVLSYPPAAPESGAKDGEAQVSPLAEGEDDFGPLVLPTTDGAATLKGWDDMQVLPQADDDFLLDVDGALAKGWDQVQVLPQADDVLPVVRSYDGAAAKGLEVQVLPAFEDDFLVLPDAFDGVAKDWDDMQVLPGLGDETVLALEHLLAPSDIHPGLSGGFVPTQDYFEQVRDVLDPWA
ncbi:M10 family metallopeptidase C-terminal domain-containing protein [Roseibacterium beibuensis]|uniref:M10 family metallopeptidase C-terminal domain-containing protein n=1 Tax=[Roseibacterium] beibuensis TaxID=1193142 RepID=UPI00217EED95|nr:M10 family metallopeptidase C-terminal domain-containing protein [Roseibacterium beibuensis]MCS6627355.1 M10 family metallopeptidase C-terminal domain-containing protein [Roseibacterium beibuensis]